jgi:arsenite methyltransferase
MSTFLQDAVKKKYGEVGAGTLDNDHAGVRQVAEAFGYSAAELDAIPSGANVGLSCGNPTAFASLKPGEVVVDLGCGGGLDVFLASAKVGPAGKAIGIDMTPEMIARAKKNAERDADGNPYTNVEFHLATIDRLPLEDSSVDCVISNCVINLAEDKPAVFREIARVLKPGGRLAVSDIALKKALPPEMTKDAAAYIGCLAGAIFVDEYREGLRAAGFSAVEVVDTKADLNAYAAVEGQSVCCSPTAATSTNGLTVVSEGCCSPAMDGAVVHEGLSRWLAEYDVNEFAASVKVFGVKD